MRHIRAVPGRVESEYTARWDLPASLKLVAKGYSAQRSQMASQIGLGEQGAGRGRKAG